MQNKLTLKLIGTTSMKFAKKIGQKITLDEITKGDKRVKIETEKSIKGVTMVMNFKGELYEFSR